jgi:hypothetical protein
MERLEIEQLMSMASENEEHYMCEISNLPLKEAHNLIIKLHEKIEDNLLGILLDNKNAQYYNQLDFLAHLQYLTCEGYHDGISDEIEKHGISDLLMNLSCTASDGMALTSGRLQSLYARLLSEDREKPEKSELAANLQEVYGLRAFPAGDDVYIDWGNKKPVKTTVKDKHAGIKELYKEFIKFGRKLWWIHP